MDQNVAELAEELLNLEDADAAFKVDDDLGNLIRAYKQKKSEKKELEDQAKEIGREAEKLNEQIVTMMDARSVVNLKMEGVGTVYQRTKAYTSVQSAERLVDWLDSHGEGDLATRGVHNATLTSWYNERLERGEEVPPADVVSAFVKTTIAIRK